MNKKKTIILAFAAVMTLAVAGTSLAATTDPFDDVPAKHWAYDSIQALAKAGIVTGYDDGAFKGDKNLTRYEMAVIVAKAMSKAKTSPLDQDTKDILTKLKTEFGDELKNLGVRVEKIEKTSPSMKITADGRLRYWKNVFLDGNSKNNENPSLIQERVRINLSADVTDNVQFIGIVTAENTSNMRTAAIPGNKFSYRDKLFFDQAEFLWTNKKFTMSAGRSIPILGQGLIWGYYSFDRLYATYDFGKIAVSGGYGDLNAYDVFNNASVNVAVANVAVKASDKVTLTAAYLDALNPKNVTTAKGYNYNFKQVAYGANANIGEFTLAAETIKNHADNLPAGAQKSGWFTRLQWRGIDVATPGSYGITFDYMKIGNWAVDSESWGHILAVPGSDGIGGHGAKGYGVTVNYVIAKNIDAEVAYYKLKPYDSAQAGFNSYKDIVGITTNFRF